MGERQFIMFSKMVLFIYRSTSLRHKFLFLYILVTFSLFNSLYSVTFLWCLVMSNIIHMPVHFFVFFEESLFRFCIHFKIQVLVFLLLSRVPCSCSLSFHRLSCHCAFPPLLCRMSLAWYNHMRLCLFSGLCAQVTFKRNLCLNECQGIFPRIFSFIVLVLPFNFFKTYFDLISVHNARRSQISLFCMWLSSCLGTVHWWECLFLLWVLGVLFKN